MNPREQIQAAGEHQKAGRWAAAEAIYRELLQRDPSDFAAVFLLGGLFIQSGQFDAAIAALQRAIQLQPGFADAHYNLGIAFRSTRQFDRAVAAFNETVRLNPNNAAAFNNLGVVLCETGRFDEGVAAYRRVVQLQPAYADAHYNLGLAFARIGQTEQAIEALQRAIELRPQFADPYLHLGVAYRQSGALDKARGAFEQAVRLNPASPAHKELAQLHAAAKNHAAALRAFDAALRVQPNDAPTWIKRASTLVELGRYDDAVASHQQAIALHPDDPEIHFTFGIMLQHLNEFDGAITAFQRAIALRPAFFGAFNDLGTALQSLGRLNDAAAAYRQAMELEPSVASTLHSNLIFLKLHDPNATPADIREELRQWQERHIASIELLPTGMIDPDPERRLRIGYVSPDFRQHVVADNLLPLFGNHDHQRFEIFCYSTVAKEDPMTARFRAMADGWRDIRSLNFIAAAELIAQDKIDILVDLTVHSGSNRLLIFARRPAPVQVTFAGYPGSTGLRTIDYRLTDPYLDPPELDDAHYSETSYRLPHSFWCYQPYFNDVAVAPPPALQNGFVTFGFLGQFTKVNERTIELWMRVLKAVPTARLLMLVPSVIARERLLAQMAEHVAPDRIHFVFRQLKRAYLETYHRIDVVLDPLPYNGHTTSLDALWMGVPVLTLAGQTVVGRAGVSQLTNLGLTEFITRTEEDFIARAASIAGDIPALAELRRTLRGRMEASPLMDARGFARDIEHAYRTMWKKWCATQGQNAAETG
jgi:protein O-GlcNAc transferase